MKCVFILVNFHLWNFYSCLFLCINQKYITNAYFSNVLICKGEDMDGIPNVTVFIYNKSTNNLTELLVTTEIFNNFNTYLRSECLSKFSKCLKSPILHKIYKRSVQKGYETSQELSNLNKIVIRSSAGMNPMFLEKERPTGQSQDSLNNCIQKIVGENGHLTLNCPDVILESRVEWYKDNLKLNSSFRTNMDTSEKEPHLTIDSYNSLYILQATKDEEGNYTCYIDGKSSQTYCVKVVSKSKLLNEDFFRYSLYLGFVLSLTIICYCAGIGVAWHQRGYFADPLYLSLNNK